MSERQDLARTFLATTPWGDAHNAPLAGDASNRSYRRLSHPETGETAVLMDAPPERGEDVCPFIRIARYLEKQGLSAPRILAADEANGFLLLEDLGDDLYARVVVRDKHSENDLYAAATDALIHLHNAPPPDGIPTYSVEVMSDLAALAFDWYARMLGSDDTGAHARFLSAMSSALVTHAPETDVLIQRDYHAENLLWLPERTGVARVGLLDFQDGARGHRAYDLVSLLQDARRDVSPVIEREMITHYVTATNMDAEKFDAAYHVLGTQRNMRILGVFARLCCRDNKPHYVDLIPRVWDALMRDLSHPALVDVRATVADVLPEPTPENLKSLKEKCAICPAQ